MAIENKYRVHEVAKDFGAATKEITEILTQYCTTPKNHMQALSDQELSVIFEVYDAAPSGKQHGGDPERADGGAADRRSPVRRPAESGGEARQTAAGSPAAGVCQAGGRKERGKQGRARRFDQGQAGTPHRYPRRAETSTWINMTSVSTSWWMPRRSVWSPAGQKKQKLTKKS